MRTVLSGHVRDVGLGMRVAPFTKRCGSVPVSRDSR
jgi:hypothetical protein